MRKGLIWFAVGLFLISFIWPFSYLPNPLGIAYLLKGGYVYDPRLPLVANGFAILTRGDVDSALSAKLDGLVGTTGLDPLDPNHPLQRYEIESVEYGAGDWAYGTVKMMYADGSSRRYRMPVVQHSQSWGRPGGWAYTGLDRYFAPHRELPDIPFAGPEAPVHLGTPVRLPLDDETQQLGTGLLYAWYTSPERRGEDMVWSPKGDAFLLSVQPDPRDRQTDTQLYLVKLVNGGEGIGIARNAEDYSWSSDGQWIIFLRLARPQAANQRQLWDIVTVDRDGREEHVLGLTDLPASPAVIGDVVWYIADNALWRASRAEGKAVRVTELPGLEENNYGNYNLASVALAPDGQRLAYRCGDALCLINVNGQGFVRVDLDTPPRGSTPVSKGSGSPLPAPTLTPPLPPGPVPTAPPAQKPSAGPPDLSVRSADSPAVRGPAPSFGWPDDSIRGLVGGSRRYREVPQRPAFARLALAWSPDGDRLAAVASDYQEGAMPTLRVVDRSGKVLQRIVVGPDGVTRSPQWTPDGRWLFLNTFPWAGRRILAVEVESGRVFDLSQPHWDTFFSLAPDGRRLVLWNGRGGFWSVSVDME